MSNTALITGASSGIGKELARYHASKGGDVILVARRTEALETLKAELMTDRAVQAHIFTADLAKADAPQKLYNDIKAAGLPVDILINNAGLGGHGKHIDRDWAAEENMINLNIRALTHLCHLFGKDMADNKSGKILNVGSTAGMMPGPLQAVYFATKAYVRSYSMALAHELKDTGVTVTVLAPGAVKTEFFETADLTGTSLGNDSATADSVAKIGYDAMMNAELHIINDTKLNIMLNWITPFMPHKMVMGMIARMQTKS